jgi:hypothetical protein
VIYFVIYCLCRKSFSGNSTGKPQKQEASSQHKLKPLSVLNDDPDTAQQNNFAKDELLKYLKSGPSHSIRNIAITGPYGAGKSTFIERVLKQSTNLCPVTLSLAKFTGSENAGSLEQIKYSLVQQLVYRENPSELPGSKVSRLTVLTPAMAAKMASQVLLFIIALTILAGWDKKIPLLAAVYTRFLEVWKSSWIGPAVAAALLGFALLILLHAGYRLITLLIIQIHDFRLDKVSTKHLQASRSDDGSLVNRYADELLYFFSVTKTRLVAIEDLDRFDAKDSIQLFTELRELNSLINHSPLIEQPVFFLYAVKDSLLPPHERTKFFELVIPIVPIVNNTTTKAQLIKRLEENGIQIIRDEVGNTDGDGWLRSDLVKTCASYLHDMRMLENIVNEFVIIRSVHSHLTGDNSNLGKIFSLVVIKNLLPVEFEKLIRNNGAIFEFIKDIRESSISQKIVEIDRLSKQIRNSQEMVKYNHSAVAGAVIVKALEEANIESHDVMRINGHSITLILHNEEVFNNLLINNRKIYTIIRSNGTQLTKEIPFKIIYEQYGKSQQQLADARDADIENLIQERDDLQKQYGKIKNAPLSSGLTEQVWDNFTRKNTTLSIENQEAYKLVVTLIKMGFLDEGYFYYTSVFQSGDLSQEEVAFCHNLQGRISKQRDIRFEVPRVVCILDELSPRALADGWGLHPSFMEYFYDFLKHKCSDPESVT